MYGYHRFRYGPGVRAELTAWLRRRPWSERH